MKAIRAIFLSVCVVLIIPLLHGVVEPGSLANRPLQLETTLHPDVVGENARIPALAAMDIVPVVAINDTAPKTPETAALKAAIAEYQQVINPEDFTALNKFLQDNPDSPYRAGLLLNLGELAYHYGYYTKALAAYEESWSIAKKSGIPETADEQKIVAGSGIRLANLYARLGRRAELQKLLKELEPLPKWGPDANLYEQSLQGVSMMENEPGKSYNCGPYALLNIAKSHPELQGNLTRFIEAQATPDQGFTVGQLEQLADDAGMNMVAVRRTLGQELPLPAVVHWKAGHYAAVLEKEDGRYLIKDPTFGTEFWMSAKALDEEASGVFLVLAQEGEETIPANLEAASVSDRRLTGKGLAFLQNILNQMRNRVCEAFPGGGMAAVGYNLFEAKAYISDTPLSYTPPKGPPVKLQISYFEGRLPDQVAPNTATIGDTSTSLWTMNFLSTAKLADNGASTASFLTTDGRKETYRYITTANFTVGNLAGNLNPISGLAVERLSANVGYLLRAANDLTTELKHIVTSGTAKYYLNTGLTNIIGQSTTLTYGNVTFPHRLASITDNATNAFSLQYGNATHPYWITGITSPFGNISLTYDSNGRLASITDPAGITSSFTYGNATYPSRVTMVSTPYGNTMLESRLNEEYEGYRRTLLISHPDGSHEQMTYANPGFVAFQNIKNATIYFGKRAMFAISQALGPGADLASTSWLNDAFYYSKRIYWYDSFDTLLATGVPIEIDEALVPGDYYSHTDLVRYLTYNSDYDGIPVTTQPTTIEDDDQTIEFTYNTRGNVLTATHNSRRLTYTYDSEGLDLQSVAMGNLTANATVLAYGSYSNHLPGTVTDVAGTVTRFTYSGNLVTQIDAGWDGMAAVETTFLIRDGNGYVTEVRRAGDGITGNATVATMSYSGGLLQTAADARGFGVTGMAYDGLQRPTSANYTDGTYETWSYDVLNVATHRDQLGQVTAYTHDAAGRVLTETDAAGRTTSYAWCGCGALLSFTDAGGRTTSYDYDLAGRLLSKTLADGSVYRRTLDEFGRVTAVSFPSGAGAAYGYNGDSSVANITYSGTGAPGALSFNYDPLFGYVSNITQGGDTVSYTHGGVGSAGALKVTDVDGPWGNDTIHYDYDLLGRLTGRAVTEDGGGAVFQSETYSYDGLDRVTTANTTLGNFTFAYAGNSSLLASAAYPNGLNTTLGYLAVGSGGWLANITNNVTVGNVTTLFSKFAYQHRGDGGITTWDQEFGWAPGVAGNIGATQQWRWSFNYDGSGWLKGAAFGPPKSGNATALQDTIENWVYGYDGSGNQLSSSVNQAGIADQFNSTNELTLRYPMGPLRVTGTVDKPANVTVDGEPTRLWSLPGGRDWSFEAKVVTSGGAQNITINATDQGNRVTSQVWRVDNEHTAADFTYNADGAMLARVDNAGSNITEATTAYTWDSLGRLTGYDDGVANVTFGYDPLGRRNRLTATVANVTTTEYYLWDGNAIAQQRVSGSASANITRCYYGDGYQTMNGTTVTGNYFYTKDHLGSIREVTDNSGNLTGRYSYGPWGETLYFDYSGGNVTQPDFGYTGHFRTANAPGLYFTLFRIYDPGLRRWLGPDPVGAGLTGYDYASNDPVNTVDPYGLWEITLCGGYIVGGKTTIGYNNGQWSWGLYIGVGGGLSASFDPHDGPAFSVGTTYGIEGEGDIGLGSHVNGLAHIGTGYSFGENYAEISAPIMGTIMQGAVANTGEVKGPTFGIGVSTVVGFGGVHHYTPTTPAPPEPAQPTPASMGVATHQERPYDGGLFDM